MIVAEGRPFPGEDSAVARGPGEGSGVEGRTGEFETESRPRRCRRDLTGEEGGEEAAGAGDEDGVEVGTCRVIAEVRG